MKFRIVAICLATGACSLASAQQLLSGVTGPECARSGGHITTWTSTAGIVPQRGECLIPPAINRSRASPPPSSNVPGAAAGVLGAVQEFLGTLGEIERQREERREYEERVYRRELERQERIRQIEDEMRRATERGVEQARRELAEKELRKEISEREEREAHVAGIRAKEQRQLQDEAELLEREKAEERRQAEERARLRATAPDPFASSAHAAGGFKTDAQIKTECARSTNAASCEKALMETRSRDPAYRRTQTAQAGRSNDNARPPQTASRVMPRHWQGTGNPADCKAANNLERNTASYYDMCLWPKGLAKGDGVRRRVPAYLPLLDPEKLAGPATCSGLELPPEVSCSADAIRRQCEAQWVAYPDEVQRCVVGASLELYARAQCKGVVDPEDRQECMGNAKARLLLAEEPAVRRICAGYRGDQQRRCIDIIYFKGPAAEERVAKAKSPDGIAAAPGRAPSGAYAAAAPAPTPHDGCPSGQGMKSTPGGFGATSCQPLGSFATSGPANRAGAK